MKRCDTNVLRRFLFYICLLLMDFVVSNLLFYRKVIGKLADWSAGQLPRKVKNASDIL